MSFIPPQQPHTDSEAAKARAQEIHENALHHAERHREGDNPVETRPDRLLMRLREALRKKRASE